MKAARFAAVAIALACFGLAGCHQQSNAPAAPPSASAPDAPAGLSVSNGRLVLPAVKGNPGAVYFDIANHGDADTSIAGVSVDGAKSAMLHTTVQSGGMSSMTAMASIPVPKGQTVRFAPGGNHVMAMDLDSSLMSGGKTDVTLTFATGDKISFPAAIEAPGAAR